MPKTAAPAAPAAPTVQLTSDDRAVLEAIRAFFAENGYAPDYREIAERCGWRTWSTVGQHLSALQEAGLLTYTPKKARTIVLE